MLSFKAYLLEQEIEIRPVENAWSDLGDTLSTYIPNVVYLVKKLPKVDKYEVNFEGPAGRLLSYGKLNKLELDDQFTKIRPKDVPDAEGYEKYRQAGNVEAVQNNGDSIRVQLTPSKSARLQKGDYLLRRTIGDKLEYSVAREADFENGYTKK